jgi:hypothetical protein
VAKALYIVKLRPHILSFYLTQTLAPTPYRHHASKACPELHQPNVGHLCPPTPPLDLILKHTEQDNDLSRCQRLHTSPRRCVPPSGHRRHPWTPRWVFPFPLPVLVQTSMQSDHRSTRIAQLKQAAIATMVHRRGPSGGSPGRPSISQCLGLDR